MKSLVWSFAAVLLGCSPSTSGGTGGGTGGTGGSGGGTGGGGGGNAGTGRQIAFRHQGISIIREDGSGLVTLPSTLSDSRPDWSPDGTRFVVESANQTTGANEVWTLNADGSNRVKLGNGGAPRWSPDGQKIAFVLNGIAVMSADGGGAMTLPGTAGGIGPCWSPDGGQLAFAVPTEPNLYVIDADGSNKSQLPSMGGVITDPAFSPDGTMLAFTFTGTDLKYRVWSMSVDGGNPVQLSTGNADEHPAWSPDGRKLAFRRKTTNYELYLMSADGGAAMPITSFNQAGQANDSPDWKP